jgi:hypothetical protein
VVQAVSKQSKSVVISLMPDRIILMSDDTTNHKFWCTIKTGALFYAHLVEGAAGTNEFRIEMEPGRLSKALKLVNQLSRSLSIRLSKLTGSPVLNVIIEEPGYNTHKNREISHNIPLQIISRNLYHNYDKQVYPVNVLFEMTDMPKFSDSARKMKQLGRSVIITLITDRTAGSEERTMTVTSSHAIGCSVRTVFKNIRLSAAAGVPLCDEPVPDPDEIQIKLESKPLHQFLSAFRTRNAKLMIGIRVDEYVTFFMSGNEYEIDYLLPALIY